MLVTAAPDLQFASTAILRWKTARLQLSHNWNVRYMVLSRTGGVLYARALRVEL